MTSLIGFELRKIITKKATFITAIAIFALLATFNILIASSETSSFSGQTTLRGLDAIKMNKEAVDTLAGTITNERITHDFREFQALYDIYFDDDGTLKDEYSGSTAPEELFEYVNLRQDYLTTFTAPWRELPYENPISVIPRIDTHGEVDFYRAAEESFRRTLDANMGDT